MYAQFRKLALAAAIASILTIVPTTSLLAADRSAEAIAARQEGQIWTTYALSPFLRANDIEVSVVDGKATLTGTVEEDVNRDLAKELALGVEGITAVDNQIAVKADYVAPTDSPRRAYAERVDDASVSAAVRSKLAWSQQLNDRDTTVSTQRGRVTLTGTVASATDRDLAQRLAASTRGVSSVDNRLQVGTVATKSSMEEGSDDTAAQAVADSWITTKVKSTFMFSDNVDANDITVSTDSGTVTLSGKVHSGAERALAIELAKNVRGVTAVSAEELVLL
jgi:osmotically-inducible protein OsmY